MRFFRFLLVAGFLSICISSVRAEENPQGKPLPPDKTQIIHENLSTLPEDEMSEQQEKDLAEQAPPTSPHQASGATMTAERVAEIMQKQNITLQGELRNWQFHYREMQVFLLIDSEDKRINLATPLARLDLLRKNPEFIEVNLLRDLLKANYFATGDVRFSMNNDIVWVSFLHPLDTLTERDLESVLVQLVETARQTRRAGD